VRAALAAGPAGPGDFTVQVSAFQSLAEARTFATKLERAGFKPFIVRSKIAGKGTWFRVRLGRFSTEAEANRAKQILARAEIPAWVLITE
jgi:cell division septation protein DedD